MRSDALVSDPYLRLAEVEREVGLGRSTIYREMHKGAFPLARQLRGGPVRWLMSEIKAWKDAHPPVTLRPPPQPEAAGLPPAQRRGRRRSKLRVQMEATGA